MKRSVPMLNRRSLNHLKIGAIQKQLYLGVNYMIAYLPLKNGSMRTKHCCKFFRLQLKFLSRDPNNAYRSQNSDFPVNFIKFPK